MAVTPTITYTAITLGSLGVSSNIVISSSVGDTFTVGVSYVALGIFMCLLRIVIDDTRNRGGIHFVFNLLLGGIIAFIFGFGLYSVSAPVEAHLPMAMIALFIGEDIGMWLIGNGQSYILKAIHTTKDFGIAVLKDIRDIF